jgi:putative FmdB family regulatory protein
LYEYSCVECGERFEQYRKVNARSEARCPGCGGRGRRVFHPVGIIFKGSGFHSTDYRRPEDKGQSEDKGGPAAPEGEGKSTAAAKPEAAAAKKSQDSD